MSQVNMPGMNGWVNISNLGATDNLYISRPLDYIPEILPAGPPRASRATKQVQTTQSIRDIFYIGICHAIGLQTEKDTHKALCFFEKAAEQGMVEAQFLVARYHLDEKNEFSDRETELKYLMIAAENNHTEAQLHLADHYDYHKKYDHAFSYYKQAADKENPTAQFKVGYYYMKGRGAPLDLAQSFIYMKQAAEQRISLAQVRVGLCYDQGLGVPIDSTKALEYFHLAAKNGNALAYYNLGNCYQEGIIVEKDIKQAYLYYKQSLGFGYLGAQKAIDILTGKAPEPMPDPTDFTHDFEIID